MWVIKKKIKKGEYFYALVPDHPRATKNGYVLYHRIVMENKIGRILTKKELVHHKNENKKDNRISNLQIVTHKKHRAIHSKGRKMSVLVCSFCKKKFSRPHNQSPEAKGYLRSFCSRSCNGKFQRKMQMKST